MAPSSSIKRKNYDYKLDKYGIITRNKARLVVQGYNQNEGKCYYETFVSMEILKAISPLIDFSIFKEFTLYKMDVKECILE